MIRSAMPLLRRLGFEIHLTGDDTLVISPPEEIDPLWIVDLLLKHSADVMEMLQTDAAYDRQIYVGGPCMSCSMMAWRCSGAGPPAGRRPDEAS